MSIHTRIILTALLILSSSLQSAAQTLSVKVFKAEGSSYYYGKVFIPKGGKYKLKHTQEEGKTINLYYGHVDANRLYMMSMIITEDRYYIDATQGTHAFIVRSTKPDDVIFEHSPEEDQAILDANSSFYFGSALGRQNKLRYTETLVANSDLREQKTFNQKSIYVMTDPEKESVAFRRLDQFNTTADLSANSLYVLGNKSLTDEELNMIWPDDDMEIETGIKAVKSVETSAGSRRADTDAIYTLQGVRVSRTEKGRIYIRNGRKFIAQ